MIMQYDIGDVTELAIKNKGRLRNKFFCIPIFDSDEYKFKISGIGKRYIKIEKFFGYDEIIKSILSGNDNGFEFLIAQIIVDPNKTKKRIHINDFELKERALVNKDNLKRKFINITIGTKEYGFRLAGIGKKAIKLELFISYEDISKELRFGNDATLEFILYELLLDNEMSCDDFRKKIENSKPIEKPQIESKPTLKIFTLQKLPEDEVNSIISKYTGFERLVFDSIDDIIEDEFTVELLLNQNRIKAYQIRGENLEPKVVEVLNKFVELGILICKSN